MLSGGYDEEMGENRKKVWRKRSLRKKKNCKVGGMVKTVRKFMIRWHGNGKSKSLF